MEQGERAWKDMTPEEKHQRRWGVFTEPRMEFAGPEAAGQYKARAARLKKAILLEGEADRVPVCTLAGLYPATVAGLTPYEAMHDYGRAMAAWHECNQTLQPDSAIAPIVSAVPARAFATLDVRLLSWPGHGVPETAGFQYNEGEWMTADEYDLLIDDPTDFLLHVYMPRIASGLKGLSHLVSPMDMMEVAASGPYLARWANPEVQESLDKLRAAAQECGAWAGNVFGLIGRLRAEGFPATLGPMSKAPFDVIGDTLRGTRGIMMDMFRQPDVLLEACDRMVGPCVKWITRSASPFNPPLVFMPLHKGADAFMNDEQFRKFYWPSLLKVILGLVDDGFTPYLFAEGAYNSRLEVIAGDLPRGRTVWHFDRTDMRRAKEILGGVACVQGNVPATLLQLGTVEEVKTYCRELIEVAAPGGGFILDVGATVDWAKPENMMAMLQAAKETG